ncbi:MAG TPA: 6-bladed beta-propeller [Longimicrobiales bacterium]
MATDAQFGDFFEKVDTLTPEQNSEQPIISLSGITFTNDGTFVVADASEASVKAFEAGGRLRTILGRQGKGPGEFIRPRFPIVGSDGRIYVGHSQEAHISVFDETGAFIDRVALPLSPLMGFARLADGRFLVTGLVVGRQDRNVLHLFTPEGELIRSYLPIRESVPAGEPESPLWDMVRWYHLRSDGRKAYVTSTILNTIWEVDVETGGIREVRVDFNGYDPPHIPQDGFSNSNAIMERSRGLQMTIWPIVADGMLAVPFVKGVLNYGDPSILVVRDRSGQWFALAGAPPIVGAFGDRLVAIDDPLEDPVRLAFYRFKK